MVPVVLALARRMRAVAGDDAARARRPQGTRAGDGGAGGRDPTGTIGTIIDTGKTLSDLAQQQMGLTPDQERQLFDSGVTVVVSPPSVGYHFAGYYSPIDRFELGLRYAAVAGAAAPATRCCATRPTLDLERSAAESRPRRTGSAGVIVPVLEVDDFTRWTVDVPLQSAPRAATTGSGAGRSFSTRTSAPAMRLSIPGVDTPDLASFEGHTISTAAKVGNRNRIPGTSSFAVELTLAGMTGHGDVTTAL